MRHEVADRRPAIEVTGLSKRYGATKAVEELAFQVQRGETVALLGANGAGKTTTLSMLMGLLTPSAGSIRVLGADLTRERDAILARCNFGSPYVEMPRRLTVLQNLTAAAALYGLAAPRKRALAVAEALDLAGLLGRQTGALSAGQRTRVGLAKALVNRPEVLLLDEPTASLDPDAADWLRTALTDYQAASGAAILLASHNMTEVERLSDRVLMLGGGRIVDSGSPAELLARYGRTNMEEVFLDIARNRRRPEHKEAAS